MYQNNYFSIVVGRNPLLIVITYFFFYLNFRCECKWPYRGTNCTDEFQPCLNHKCENGAICENDAQSEIGYSCKCMGEYR